MINDKQGHVIYKYIPLKYLVSLLKSKKMRFNKVTSWEDPYENFLQRQSFLNTAGEKINIENMFATYYGQCWTLLNESDAMWRIYSVKTEDLKKNDNIIDETAIKIKIESSLLEREINKSISDNDYWELCCKDVKYTDEDEIDNALNHLPLDDYRVQELFMKSLFVKRKAFDHEREFRIIIQVPSICNISKNPYISIPFNTSLISEFVLDPRLSKIQFERIRAKLLTFNIEKNRIKMSRLYAPIRKHIITIDNCGIIKNNKKYLLRQNDNE